MSRHHISSYWFVTNYILSQQRACKRDGKGGVLGELCKGCRDFQWIFVRISSESPPWGTIGLFGESYCHSTKLSWAVEGQRETKMQVGQTAALAVLSSIKGTFLIHSSLWYLLDHLQNHSLSSRFLIDWMSDIRKLIPILRCTKNLKYQFWDVRKILIRACVLNFIALSEKLLMSIHTRILQVQVVIPFSLQRWYHSCLVKANSNAALSAWVADFSLLGSGGECPPNSSPPPPHPPPPPPRPTPPPQTPPPP